jgi:hypothetical protein
MSEKIVHEYQGEENCTFEVYDDGSIIERRKGHPIDSKKTHTTVELVRLAKRVKELEAVADAAETYVSYGAEVSRSPHHEIWDIIGNLKAALKKAGYLK